MTWLSGRKTYVFAATMAVVAFARYMQWITEDAAKALEGILLGGGIAALRAGVAKGN